MLVNNAAAFVDWNEVASQADLAAAHDVIEVNLFGAWPLTNALLALLHAIPAARVVHVSSGAGSHSEPQFGLARRGGRAASYGVSKTALNALTSAQAAELADTPIVVSAVCPGLTATYPGAEDMGAHPVGEGAAGIVRAATLPDDEPRGGLFRDGQPLGWRAQPDTAPAKAAASAMSGPTPRSHSAEPGPRRLPRDHREKHRGVVAPCLRDLDVSNSRTSAARAAGCVHAYCTGGERDAGRRDRHHRRGCCLAEQSGPHPEPSRFPRRPRGPGCCPGRKECSAPTTRPRKYPEELLDRDVRLVFESGRPIDELHARTVPFFFTEHQALLKGTALKTALHELDQACETMPPDITALGLLVFAVEST